MKTCTFLFSIFFSFSLVYPEAISQVEFSISSGNGMNPYGARKHSEYSSGTRRDRMKVGYTVSHPRTQVNHASFNQATATVRSQRSRYNSNSSPLTQSNNQPINFQSYPFYEPPKASKNQYRQPTYESVDFNQFPSYKPQLQSSHMPKRINLPKKLTVKSSAALLPNASPYASQQNRNLGVNLGEALDKSVPFVYY